ncbi:hypothetical protein AM1_1446 [Acaryochloris marina MBIC11017]|uniref:Uncharacterized protein n=1 Tax=Acaryochloris marina (strain MBIC 11017) TaxID=329726 RepID=B0C7T3_ACAM1|nr:hypothetical protein AM1_1446 [Acaryochloris marina MBIC11017]
MERLKPSWHLFGLDHCDWTLYRCHLGEFFYSIRKLMAILFFVCCTYFYKI